MKVEGTRSRYLVTLGMDDPLPPSAGCTRRFHHLMVVEDGRPQGVLSWKDLPGLRDGFSAGGKSPCTWPGFLL